MALSALTNADWIFFVDGDTLRPLVATPYENEDLLQRALVDLPEVLAGRVTASNVQRRLLLVKREKGVPIAEGGGDHFSIDHFFVDSGAVPVLVEVKRQSDTRIRREVVGQMLDYAANGVRYWPIDQIQEEFEQSFEGDDPDAFLEQFSEVGDGAAFWEAVDQNLRDGHIRMLFVADGFPDELVRAIEFLNEQMSPAEVLGVEVKQYTDGDRQVLVPRVIGATTAAEQTKRKWKWTPGKMWTRTSMIEAASEFGTIEELSLVERLLDFAERSSSRISWGSGKGSRASIWHDIGCVSKYVWVIDGPRSANVPAQVWVWRKDLLTNLGEELVESFFATSNCCPDSPSPCDPRPRPPSRHSPNSVLRESTDSLMLSRSSSRRTLRRDSRALGENSLRRGSPTGRCKLALPHGHRPQRDRDTSRSRRSSDLDRRRPPQGGIAMPTPRDARL